MLEFERVSNLLGSPASGEQKRKNYRWSHCDPVSNLLGSPASGEMIEFQKVVKGHTVTVSNLLGSPASGEEECMVECGDLRFVSNLLGSPASGEQCKKFWRKREDGSFQFIGFPSEWGGRSP